LFRPAFDDLNSIKVTIVRVLHCPHQKRWRLPAWSGGDPAMGTLLA
jgi:hypothetical protein